MKKIKLLWGILKRTGTSNILISYIIFVFVAALIVMISDPGVNNYIDALWYCYAVLSTVGFGDVIVTSLIAKIVSVLVTVYSLIIIAIITGVIVNYYNELIALQRKETITHFMDKLENLPEMSKEELEELSQNVKKFRGGKS